MSAQTDTPPHFSLSTAKPRRLLVQTRRYVIGMWLLVWALVMLSITVSGFYHFFSVKKADTKQLAGLLAISATHADADLLSDQVSTSMYQDPAIDDILFYSMDNAVDITEPVTHRLSMLWRSTASVYQGVLSKRAVVGSAAESKTLESNVIDQPQSLVDQHHLLAGYINITLNLDMLRQQWLSQYWPLLAAITAIFAGLMTLTLWHLQQTLQPFIDFSTHAKDIVDEKSALVRDQDIDSVIDDLRINGLAQSRYLEFKAVDDLFNVLKKQYLDVKASLHQAQTKQATSSPSHPGLDRSFQNMVIHELKTTLESVFESMHLIDRQFLSIENAEALSSIEQQINRFNDVLDQIVQLNRIERGQIGVSLSELQPALLINEIAEKYRAHTDKKRLHLSVDIQHVDVILAGDVKKIYSIIDTLMSHAVRYTDAGEVVLKSKLDYFASRIRWIVSVTDTGLGIDDAQLQNIFLPFYRSKEQVDGSAVVDPFDVGLGIANKLAELMGGALTVDSVKGEGSTFYFTLMLQDWQRIRYQRLLEGIRIVSINEEPYDGKKMSFARFGAIDTPLTQSQALLAHLSDNLDDVLLLPQTMSKKTVSEMCGHIRAMEHSHRIIIAWYAKNVTAQSFASMQAAGLDYIIEPATSKKNQAYLIKSWVTGSIADPI